MEDLLRSLTVPSNEGKIETDSMMVPSSKDAGGETASPTHPANHDTEVDEINTPERATQQLRNPISNISGPESISYLNSTPSEPSNNHPPIFNASPASGPAAHGPLPNVYSIEEFEKLHAATFEAAAQKQAAKESARQISANPNPQNSKSVNPKFKASPFPFLPSTPHNGDGGAEEQQQKIGEAQLKPVQLLGKKGRDPADTVALYQKCQALGIANPEVEFTGKSEEGWGVELSIAGERVVVENVYASKREAKEVGCGLAIVVLERLVEEGKVKGKGKGKGERKRGEEEEVVEEWNEQNWIGRILEYQNALSAPKPIYTEFILGTKFCCELSLPTTTSSPSSPPTSTSPLTFGSQTVLFTSKKAARQNAAKEAVQYLKAQGLWPEENGDGTIKKRRKKVETSSPGWSSRDKLTTDETPTLLPSSPFQIRSNFSTPSTPIQNPSTYTSLALTLAHSLSLPPPEYVFQPSPNNLEASGFYTLACYFKDPTGEHSGPIGEVRHVFGKRKAKEECARLVVGYLEEVRKMRVEGGMRMIREMEERQREERQREERQRDVEKEGQLNSPDEDRAS
ncbi:hypothetical protein GQ43DRAFT_436507 [Delitschia confertaspora ATCC 74209]|uniref:DRBM domain-containing protein n=1 Tax=Delitschia confertaspora ATCC 74209 TaxID=1513339 RepID=A0A9P4JVK9_9PLEO|nr:hypothetical protein GQ43DRAFT_436507 [Delitschia confertaspora ATCC 74209]